MDYNFSTRFISITFTNGGGENNYKGYYYEVPKGTILVLNVSKILFIREFNEKNNPKVYICMEDHSRFTFNGSMEAFYSSIEQKFL